MTMQMPYYNANTPTDDEKAALAGTSGNPGDGNEYVTDEDSRLHDRYEPEIYSPDTLLNLAGGVTGGWSTYSGDTYQFDLELPEPAAIYFEGSEATEGSDEDSLNDHEWYYKSSNNTLYFRDDTGSPDDLDKTDLQFRVWTIFVGAGTDHFSAPYQEAIFLDSSDNQGFVVAGRRIRSSDKTITIRFRARTANGSSSGTIYIENWNRAIGSGIASDVSSLSFDKSDFDVTSEFADYEFTANVSDLEAESGDLWEILFSRAADVDSVDSSLAIDYRSIEVEHA